jgi:DNA polymerase I
MARALILDTYSLFFRSFHALPMMNTAAGQPTNALYGFMSLLIKLWREQKPFGTAFALDAPTRTFRHEMYAEYKAERARAPDPLVKQLAVLDVLIEKSGLPRFRVPGFEADDVLATLARELEAAEHDVLVVSGDRDLLQLVTPRTHVLFTGRRGKDSVLYDEAKVEERFGIPASKLPQWISLVGDTSDNIKGVTGIGPGTAAKLLAQRSSIAELLAHLDEESASIRDKLRPEAERLLQNESLATLRRDVPLEDGPRVGVLQASAFAALLELFQELEFKSLITRLQALETRDA